MYARLRRANYTFLLHWLLRVIRKTRLYCSDVFAEYGIHVFAAVTCLLNMEYTSLLQWRVCWKWITRLCWSDVFAEYGIHVFAAVTCLLNMEYTSLLQWRLCWIWNTRLHVKSVSRSIDAEHGTHVFVWRMLRVVLTYNGLVRNTEYTSSRK